MSNFINVYYFETEKKYGFNVRNANLYHYISKFNITIKNKSYKLIRTK